MTKRGFTLIELLVVIAIIGILSSIVLASLNTARLKSRDTRRVADLKQLQLALALYFDSNAAYPATLALLGTQYIAVLPTDPVTKASYFYAGNSAAAGGTCTSYHIGAILEDTANQALTSDPDAAVAPICAGSNADFNGTSVACTATAGVAQGQPSPTEACYDVKP